MCAWCLDLAAEEPLGRLKQAADRREKEKLCGSCFLSHSTNPDHTGWRQLGGVWTAVTFSHIDLSLALGKLGCTFP